MLDAGEATLLRAFIGDDDTYELGCRTRSADEIAAELQSLADAGYRTLGVACGPLGQLSFIGLIALGDPPRADSRALLDELHVLGVPTVMVTGDAAATAATVARSGGAGLSAGEDPQQRRPQRFRRIRRRFSGRQVSPGQGVPATGARRRDVRRRGQRRSGPAPGTDGYCGVDCDRCRQSRSRHRPDRSRPWRDHHLHQRRAVGVSARAYLHVEHSRQQIRDARRIGGRAGHDRTRGADAAASGACDAGQ